MVGKPTNPRRRHPHCMQLDIGWAAEKGTKEKLLLAADDVGTLLVHCGKTRLFR
jgi:hypothetical protein